jgi:hypothetical protein
MFWVINHPLNLDTDTVYGVVSDCESRKIWESDICSECHRITALRQVGDLCIELFGNHISDFVWIDDTSIIISQKLAYLLKDTDLKGFSLRKVDIVSWLKDDTGSPNSIGSHLDLPVLFQLDVYGSGGSIFPQNKSQQISKCDVCNTVVLSPLKKIIVDVLQWDGSDIFKLNEFPGYILLTEKFRDFLSANKIQGYQTIPSEEFPGSRLF